MVDTIRLYPGTSGRLQQTLTTYTTRPLVVEDGLAIAPDAPGTGVTFDWDALRPFAVAL